MPNVILRDATERVEVIECGASVLSGTKESNIFEATRYMMEKRKDWKIPEEYLYNDVSERVCTILYGQYGWEK